MKTLYNISYIATSGLRTMLGPAQGRHMFESAQRATAFLIDFLENGGLDRVTQVYGPQAVGTFRVDAFECYDHGDPVSIYPREP